MNKILLVEDDLSVGESLKRYLEGENFEVDWVRSLKEANDSIEEVNPKIVILDWMLPDGVGIDLMKSWRMQKIDTPIIFLTAKSELFDRILGLEMGANDYITKPFEPRELLARIRVQLRGVEGRSNLVEETDLLKSDNISFNRKTLEVQIDGRQIDLAKMELSLLRFFLEAPKQVFSRNELLDRVWGYDCYPTTRTVDNHVLMLRQKLGADRIETVRGLGYRWRLDVNSTLR